MTGTLFPHIFVAVETVVLRKRNAHRMRAVWHVLAMTGNALLSIKFCQPISIRWIVELAGRMSVLRGFEIGSVTRCARILLHSHELRVTRVAGEFNLVVPMGCLTGEQSLLRRRVSAGYRIRKVTDAQKGQQRPCNPKMTIWDQDIQLSIRPYAQHSSVIVDAKDVYRDQERQRPKQ